MMIKNDERKEKPMTKSEIKKLFPAKHYQTSCDKAAKRIQKRNWTINGRPVIFSGISNNKSSLYAVFTFIGDNNQGVVEFTRYSVDLGDALDTITGNLQI